MEFGILLRSQFLPEDDPADCFDAVCQMARHADQLGFCNIVKGSHFGTDDLMALAKPLIKTGYGQYLRKIALSEAAGGVHELRSIA